MQRAVHLTHEMRAAENVSKRVRARGTMTIEANRLTFSHFVLLVPALVINYRFIATKIDSRRHSSAKFCGPPLLPHSSFRRVTAGANSVFDRN